MKILAHKHNGRYARIRLGHPIANINNIPQPVRRLGDRDILPQMSALGEAKGPGSGIITCIITYLVGCFEAISWECLVNRVRSRPAEQL